VQVLASLAALAVVCTAVAFVLFFKLIAEAGPARALVITYVNPAVAVALGVAVLGEPLTPAIVAAFVLILAGSVLATRPGQPGRPGLPETAGSEPGGAAVAGPAATTAGTAATTVGNAATTAGTPENAPAGEAAPG
jgi:hypothetical protein